MWAEIGVAGIIYQFTKPAHRADQAAFAHTMKAPAPSLSLGGGLIYSPAFKLLPLVGGLVNNGCTD